MRYITMNDMLPSFYTKQHNKMRGLYIDGLGYHGDTKFVIIRLDHSWVLKFMARATILALVIVSLPWINTIIGYLSRCESNSAFKVHEMAFNPINLEFLPIIFRDLANEGLLRMGDRSLLVTSGNEEVIYNSQIVKDYNPDLISFSDSTRQDLVPNETFDFVFSYGFPQSSNFIERALKVGGIVVAPLSNNPMAEFPQPSNYKIVYVRKFDSTIVAMRKTRNVSISSSSKRRLCNSLTTNAREASGLNPENEKLFGRKHFTSLSRPSLHEFKLIRPADFEHRMPKAKKTNAKEAALKKLEDVLLEPPRAASGKSSRYLKRTRYLPDLMGVSLENYPRRVFIDVGLQDKNEGSDWFSKYYPTKNTKFEIFKIETVTKESSGKEIPMIISMSDWLKNNVKESEYVVMKAEADVVEELVKNKAIRLIDELFLECKHQGMKKGDKKNRRAYWECLALYGLLRDEGIAVHQWWG
ncbi:uncharacterized protein LOC107778799 [Nicotiana tabacum]|uniref:Uncharacterized protein LOC107778799 n=2 Tax=Nicotiana TaxID=4085 RepID=A0A1S3YRL5_TOBAC|nr:PREDICTED: uncharacterized protein LOC107778799 [Nicotiana tabacum]